ncbi:MAG: MATE family efflux transporter, partial [Emcibacteraceae bacterium]|nr:MATE family efflux transporter [Emcibacteraceae bacterium]
MTTLETHFDKWDWDRTKRQFSQLVSLSLPIIMQRLGIMTLGIVDTAMVAHYSTTEVAFQGIANSAINTTLTVALIGLMMGTMVLTAKAFGAQDHKECGRILRRSLRYAFGVGFVAMTICFFGEQILLAAGQTPEIAKGGGAVAKVLSIGLLMTGLMLSAQFFLEGINRPLPGMFFMIIANGVNIFLNWTLVWGNLGFDPMGAVGSAWATSIVRTLLTIAMFSYIFIKLDREKYGFMDKIDMKWSLWK